MTDKLEMLEGFIGRLPEAVERRKLRDRLGSSIEGLSDAEHQIGRLEALLDFAELMQFEGAILDDLRSEAWELGRDLETASSDEALRDAVHDYKNDLKRRIITAEKAVHEQWVSLSRDRFSSIRLLGELLENIGVAIDLGHRMQACASRGLATEAIVRTAEILPRARELLAELDHLQQERARTIPPGDIGDFINALAERRATLAMVSAEVHAWLAEHNALERFSLEPRQP